MCCKGRRDRDDAVSSVVGEMLLIAAVVVIIAAISINAQSILPPPRDPSVTIMMKNTTDTVLLYHKGGDAVKAGELRVVIDGVENSSFSLNGESIPDPDRLFDLGDHINATKKDGSLLSSGESVRLVTSRSVLFSGVIP
ncbi:MAG: hypothetical protein A4E38_00648 [Methanoregulaceae archaeon PtaB.Bin108]|nr:MAG: hypothetical protein A4E38_00648 [Methanoregulaceae archaeon PtaB.Bin108]OPY46309.1 MAG: hypothetical protein A4E42_00579 [Methanoregulaceae archaeon PtaU1.Bin222]